MKRSLETTVQYPKIASSPKKYWKSQTSTCLRLISHLWFPSGEFIIGRVIKAMNNSWHPDCFCCDICHAVLADVGFVKNAGR